MPLTAGMMIGGGMAGAYLLDTILDFLRQGETGRGELNLQKLILEGQREQTTAMATRGRKEEVRTERLIQQAMQMRRKEQQEANIMQLLAMIQGQRTQTQSAISGFAGAINMAAPLPVRGMRRGY